jgi:hypothetical protein
MLHLTGQPPLAHSPGVATTCDMKLAALVAAAILGLAACSPKPSSTSGDAATSSSAPSRNHDASGPITEAKLGVKIYPGARIVTSGETDEVVSANLETGDGVAKVCEFYQKELGSEGPAGSVHVTGTKNGRLYVVSLAPSGTGTAISIMGKK